MYKITAKDSEDIESESFGDFSVYKEFTVLHKDTTLSNDNIFGYIIQKVTKKTKCYVYEDDTIKILSTEDEIYNFTKKQVKYSNHNYYELFFVKKGISTEADRFQNGAISNYTKDNNNNNGKLYVDDAPPTAGVIHMYGESYYINSDKDDVIKKSKEKNPRICGIQWSTDKKTPANGLPYRETIPDSIKELKDSNTIKHTVNVIWNSIDKNKLKNANIYDNALLNHNNNNSVNVLTEKSIVHSKIIE